MVLIVTLLCSVITARVLMMMAIMMLMTLTVVMTMRSMRTGGVRGSLKAPHPEIFKIRGPKR